jgi:hypothetical protein
MDESQPRDWRSRPRKNDDQRFSCVSTLRLPLGIKATLRELASHWQATEAETIRGLIVFAGRSILHGEANASLAPARVQFNRAKITLAVLRWFMCPG